MNISEKRELLEAMEILIKRPTSANEKTISTAIQNFNKLVEELTEGYLSVIPVQKKKLNEALEDME